MTTSRHAAFWNAFDARIASYNLLTHLFYQAWSKGELTRDDLREYAAEYWHHVSAFPTYLSALHSQLPDGDLRREVLRNLAEEEGIDSSRSVPHADLWMNFAEGFGATRTEVEARTVSPEMSALLAAFRASMAEPAISAFAALYAYESRVPEISITKAEGLKRHYKADDATAKYFTLHQTADVFHANVWRVLIEQQLDAAPTAEARIAAEEAALASAERASAALWSALSAVESERQSRR